MSFSKTDLENIKNKISLRLEIEKKAKLVKKGKDYWCCCLFHKEKTASLKINDEQNSFYCFGCGAKGDIFTIYTDLYNYTFPDAVKDLAERAGINIEYQTQQQSFQQNNIFKILNITCEWFQKNLYKENTSICLKYLKSRKINDDTISKFKLGYSYNAEETLFDFLKKNSFSKEDIIKSNVVKVDNKNNIRDYFYKRLIFPIENERGNIIAFGGRALDNSNPKYINSPESNFFQKRKLLYNLSTAKDVARKKNNLLICEGYMDVISLYQNNIKSVVAPLGTALTEEQLTLAWKYSSKPTIMFDGDKAGLRASFKAALLSLPLISSNKFLQFATLSEDHDPDSFLSNFSTKKLIDILKNPQTLVNFIFNESSKAISLNNADQKIVFDKYLDDIIKTIKDKKIQYFYKNEFKSLFFQKIKFNNKNLSKIENPKKIESSLINKQLLSFIASCINHKSNRQKIIPKLLESKLFDNHERALLKELEAPSLINEDTENIVMKVKSSDLKNIAKSCLDPSIYQLFPYSEPNYDVENSYLETIKSCENLNTRLLNLKKINKSLDNFVTNSNQLNWDELQKINLEMNKESL